MDLMTGDQNQSGSLLVAKHGMPLTISTLQLLQAFPSTLQQGWARPLHFTACPISALARIDALPHQASATADRIQN